LLLRVNCFAYLVKYLAAILGSRLVIEFLSIYMTLGAMANLLFLIICISGDQDRRLGERRGWYCVCTFEPLWSHAELAADKTDGHYFCVGGGGGISCTSVLM
jgi:hypothetical protein